MSVNISETIYNSSLSRMPEYSAYYKYQFPQNLAI